MQLRLINKNEVEVVDRKKYLCRFKDLFFISSAFQRKDGRICVENHVGTIIFVNDLTEIGVVEYS